MLPIKIRRQPAARADLPGTAPRRRGVADDGARKSEADSEALTMIADSACAGEVSDQRELLHRPALIEPRPRAGPAHPRTRTALDNGA